MGNNEHGAGPGRRLFLGGAAAAAVAGAGVLASSSPASASAATHPLGWYDVTEYGAVGDNVTDDTAAIQSAIDAATTAGGGYIYFPSGIYLVGGALTDTTRSNCQLKLPAIHYVNTKQISLVFCGETPPPPVFSVVGTTPLPDKHAIIRSSLTSGSGGALLGGWGPSGSLDNFTNVMLRMENLTLRMPANPTHTAADLSRVAAVDLDNVSVDTGSYYVQGLAEPTTASSFGIRLPANNNGAYTRVDAVNVFGFYTGFEIGEHTVGRQMTAWGCKRVAQVPFGYHASKIERLMGVHCQKGIVFTGEHYLDVDQFNLEHATSGWWITSADIDDPSNYGNGVVRWHVVKAGVGVDRTFTVNGGSSLTVEEIGYGNSGSGLGWTAFTPALTSSATAPVLGTGASTGGRYSKDGTRVMGDGHITFGSSGVSAGTGTLRVSLPVSMDMSLPYRLVGTCSLYDASTGTLRIGVLNRVSATTAQIHLDGGSGTAQATVPWTWAAGDVITYQFAYESA